MDLLYKSNATNDLENSSPFKVLNFKNQYVTKSIDTVSYSTSLNHGLSHIGGRIRTKPFKNKSFTFQQAIYIPASTIDGGWIVNSDLFFEYLSKQKHLMLFGDLGFWYNSRQLPFPYFKLFAGTLLSKRIGPYVMLNLPYEIGSGLKIFIHPQVQIEFFYTWWLSLEWTVGDKKAQTFNLGINVTNFKNFFRK